MMGVDGVNKENQLMYWIPVWNTFGEKIKKKIL